MNLHEEILEENSRKQCDRIVAWVADDQQKFDELFTIFIQGSDSTLVQRSVWPISYCVEVQPHFIKKHFAALVKKLQQPNVQEPVKRNIVRMLQEVDIPEGYKGGIMDYCFATIQSVTEKAAIKAFALNVPGRLAKEYPEIIPEVKLIIEDRWPVETAAFKSSAKRFLKIKS